MSATTDGRPRLSGMARRVETTPTAISIIPAGNLPGPVGVCDGDVFDAWCWKLGPTATVLWRYLACRVGLDVEMVDAAAYLGVPRYKLFKAFDRLENFGRVHWTDPTLTTLAVVTNTHDPREPFVRGSS